MSEKEKIRENSHLFKKTGDHKIEGLFLVDEFEPLAGDILEKHLRDDQEFTNFEVISIKKTKKSVYGEIKIGERRVFYKISSGENIAGELMGFKIAKCLPHKKIIRHYYEDSGVYGLYLQDYCEEVDEGGLLLSVLNKDLLTEDPEKLSDIKDRTKEKIFKPLGETFGRYINTEPMVHGGINDRFFSERLKKDGKFGEIYGKKYFYFPSIGEELRMEDLFNWQIITNGTMLDETIMDLVNEAKINLNPKEPRVFVLSQGDMTESNITINGIFFDFETAGINSLAQELAIFLCEIYFGAHYIYAKYSPIPKSLRTTAVDDFEKNVSASCQINHDKKQLQIEMNFPFPKIKQVILENYLEQVIEPLESILPERALKKTLIELRSAILARILVVKNITNFEEKDLLLSLGFVGHFLKDFDPNQKISEFIRDRFTTIKK